VVDVINSYIKSLLTQTLDAQTVLNELKDKPGATGKLKVLRLLEAMMEGGVIDAGDIQKAIEHIL